MTSIPSRLLEKPYVSPRVSEPGQLAGCPEAGPTFDAVAYLRDHLGIIGPDTAIASHEPGTQRLTTIHLKKPGKTSWIRTHPDKANYWTPCATVESRTDGKLYLVTPEVALALTKKGEQVCKRKMLILSCTKAGTLFLWPVDLPSDSGEWHSWHSSAMEAAVKAKKEWIQVEANTSMSRYSVATRHRPECGEPIWPGMEMGELLCLAFKDRMINSLDHPVITGARVESYAEMPNAADVRGRVIAALTDKNTTAREQHKKIAEAVLDSLKARGQLYYHAEYRDFATAMFFDNHRKRLEKIQGDSFTAWVSDWIGINRADKLFTSIVAEIETAALTDAHSKGIVPEVFFVRRGDRIYMSNGDASLCRISPGKVEMLANGTDDVLFCAGHTLRPWTLTEPRDFFESCRLFSDIQDNAPHTREIVRLWTLSLPTNPKCKPPLCATGDAGSGKTRLVKGIAELLGLPVIIAKVEEKLESDFWPTVDAGGLFIMDNADSKTKWLADSVAAAATEGSVSRRRLYTDRETVTLRARAWLAITSANPTFGNDSGLADRLLVVRVRRREGITSDSALSDEIAANRDAGLSFVAQILAAALADTEPTPAGLNQRHPDFAAFAVRIGRALGRETEAVAALRAAEADKSAFCLENDTVGAALIAHLRQAGTFKGTALELMPHLLAVDADLGGWLTAKKLGKRLATMWVHITATFDASRTPTRAGCVFHITDRQAAAGYSAKTDARGGGWFDTPRPVVAPLRLSTGDFA